MLVRVTQLSLLHSSMATVINPWIDIGNYRSLELIAAFNEYFPMEEESDDSDIDPNDIQPLDEDESEDDEGAA